jgi:tetratricopeptide (TPR) repeat protein
VGEALSVQQVVQTVAPNVPLDQLVLATLLKERPADETLAGLLLVGAPAATAAALAYVGACGTIDDCGLITPCLRHTDPKIAELAEDCLWRLWMRAGTARGNRGLIAAMRCIEAQQYREAIEMLRLLLREAPDFAEAHFQLGVALCCLERDAEAGRVLERAVRLNRYHFGAIALLGHTRVALGDLEGALRYYRMALEIHPGLADVPDALLEVELALRQRQQASA